MKRGQGVEGIGDCTRATYQLSLIEGQYYKEKGTKKSSGKEMAGNGRKWHSSVIIQDVMT
jgi:hypothetical protein